MSVRATVSAVLFWCVVVLLVWVPIPLGSNRPWAWMALEVGVCALLAAWIGAWAAGWVDVPNAMRKAWPAWGLLAAWLALQVLHIVPLPESWVAVLSPESARMHSLATMPGMDAGRVTLSIDADASRASLLRTIAYCGVFFLVLAVTSERFRILRLARVLVYAALVQAIVAVLLHLTGAEYEYFGTFLATADSASGTFANRNHFAGYLEMSLALGIGLLIAGLSDRRAETWRNFFRLAIEWVLGPKMRLRLALCVLVIALTTTHSRMGNTAFFAALLVAGGLGIALSRHAPRNTVLLLASLVAIDLFIVGSWFGVEKLAQRLEQTTMQNVQEREEPARYTVALIKDYAPFGSGPGTFYVAFPKYRPESVVLFFDYAHNDYAQFAAESGVLGFLVIGAFVVASLAAALVAQWRRRDPLMRGMSFACIMGVVSILIHAWVEFNLQIPANATLFMVLLALGWISLYHDRHALPGLVNVRAEVE